MNRLMTNQDSRSLKILLIGLIQREKEEKKKNKVIEVETRYNNIKFCKHFLKKVFLRYDGYTKY